jgi:hypothetical protein
VKVCGEFEHLTRVKMLVSYVKFHSFTCKIKDHIYVKINSHVQLLFGVCRIGMWKGILTDVKSHMKFSYEKTGWMQFLPGRSVVLCSSFEMFSLMFVPLSCSNLRFYRVTLLPMIFPDHESWWRLIGHC